MEASSRNLRISFHEELAGLEEALQREGDLVVRSVQAATRALVEEDLELADEVIAFDDDVDASYFAIEEGIQSLLARQTPVASDLRLVLAMLHVNLHLERMADYCVTVAKLTKLAAAGSPEPRIVASIAEMGVRAEEMTRVALRSFQHRDVVRAEALVDLDELIDRANRRLVEHVLELDADQREWGLRMLVVSRCLERIGDHAVDIGEQTAYLVTGEFREFTDASHPEAEAGT
jgi:phosphate transport system protein